MIAVPPQEIPKHWEFVKRGLESIIEKTGEKWTPTHVLQALYEGWANLFVDVHGFAILQRDKRAWTSEPYINVWCFWLPNAAEERSGEFFVWLDEMAEKAGVGRGNWGFGSPRMGWGTKKLRDEIEIERVIYRRKNV